MGPLLAGLLGDAETEAILSDAAEIRAMLAVEAALARVQGALGLIPAGSAAAIAAAAAGFAPDPATLAPGTARDGIAVPTLVAAFRAGLPEADARWLHWGATSQDIADTALVLRLRALLDLLEARTAAIVTALAGVAALHRDTVMAARTRAQVATPTTFGLRVAGWADPLIRHRERLPALRARALAVSLGGASGTLAAMEGRGLAVMEGLGVELGLSCPDMPWHAARDRVAEVAQWLSTLTGLLAKMGQDLVLLSRSEIAEARAGTGGGSSTMPHKANPVGAEALVALARFAARLSGAFEEGLIHAEERDGAALMLEWLALPPLARAAGAATRHALGLAETLIADPARMAATLSAEQDLPLAEAATFALAPHIGRPAAQALVKAVCAEAVARDLPLRAVLAERAPVALDWAAVLDPAGWTGEAGAFVDRFLDRVRER